MNETLNKDQVGDSVTQKALKAYSQIENTRLRELVEGFIRHLHAFVRETKLSDKEFETAWTLMEGDGEVHR